MPRMRASLLLAAGCWLRACLLRFPHSPEVILDAPDGVIVVDKELMLAAVGRGGQLVRSSRNDCGRDSDHSPSSDDKMVVEIDTLCP